MNTMLTEEAALRVLDAMYDTDDDAAIVDVPPPAFRASPSELAEVRAAADAAIDAAWARYRLSVRADRERDEAAHGARPRRSFADWTRDQMMAALESLQARGVQLAFRKRDTGKLSDAELRSILEQAAPISEEP